MFEYQSDDQEKLTPKETWLMMALVIAMLAMGLTKSILFG